MEQVKSMTNTKRVWRQAIPFYIMALPGALYLICNNFMPLYGVLLAFKKLNVRKGILGSPWCGLDNFKFLFQSSTAFQIIRNTILYNLAFIVFGTIIALMLAVLLNEITSKIASRFYQSIILIPYLMSWVIASYLYWRAKRFAKLLCHTSPFLLFSYCKCVFAYWAQIIKQLYFLPDEFGDFALILV